MHLSFSSSFLWIITWWVYNLFKLIQQASSPPGYHVLIWHSQVSDRFHFFMLECYSLQILIMGLQYCTISWSCVMKFYQLGMKLLAAIENRGGGCISEVSLLVTFCASPKVNRGGCKSGVQIREISLYYYYCDRSSEIPCT